MAFVVLHNREAYTEWTRVSLALGLAHTRLAGKGGLAVLEIPDFALDELAENGIAFTPVIEAQLPEYLTPEGLAYCRRLRKCPPNRLHFQASLPPALHVALTCTVPESHVEAVRQIVERYSPGECRTRDVSVSVVPVEPDGAIESRPMVTVEFIVLRAHEQALVDELIASGAAGYSRETAIYVQSDPDGPPRGGGGSRSR
jgi:hypothetical protein